jgi:hypothetical protein
MSADSQDGEQDRICVPLVILIQKKYNNISIRSDGTSITQLKKSAHEHRFVFSFNGILQQFLRK